MDEDWGKLLKGKFDKNKKKPRTGDKKDPYSPAKMEEMSLGMIAESKKIAMAKALEIDDYIWRNKIIDSYLKRNGLKDIQSVPDAVVISVSKQWENLSRNDLIAAATKTDEKDWSEDPILYLALSRELKRVVTEE